MDILNSIILGITQGITEFLPISSSGHLIIIRDLLGIQVYYGLAFDAILQLATTLAVLVYFWKDILGYIKTFFKILSKKKKELVSRKEKTLLYAIIVGTIPAVILGFFLEETMNTLFRDVKLVAITLIVGAIIMYLAERSAKQNKPLSTSKGFTIGLYQALALIPGMSRSGMTISGGLRMGLSREEATRFSFLLAFPILFGAGIKKLFDLAGTEILSIVSGDLMIASITAFIVGMLAIHILVRFLRTHTMNVFVIYRIALAVLLLILFI